MTQPVPPMPVQDSVGRSKIVLFGKVLEFDPPVKVELRPEDKGLARDVLVSTISGLVVALVMVIAWKGRR